MLTFQMLMQQHSFSTDEWISLRNSPIFLWQKIYGSNGVGVGHVWGHLNIQPHDKCSTIWNLNCQDQMLSTSCFFWLICRVFTYGVNIQNDTCALATAFYFWLRMNGCSWEIVSFLWQKMSHSREFQPRTLAFMLNALSFEVDSDLSLGQME